MSFKRTKPKASIVIPSWFHPNQHGKYGHHETFWFAVECLERLVAATPVDDYELIIVDNGSYLHFGHLLDSWESYAGSYRSDTVMSNGVGSPQWYFGHASTLIRNESNLGFGPACNQGFALARGEYIVCLNNDILVWPGWLDALINGFDNPDAPNAGVIMPALIPNLKDANEALKLENPDFSLNAGKWGANAEFGSLWVAKKELLDKIAARRDGYQVFDETFELGMGEDRWLWCEVRLEGYQTYRCHDTRVFHQGNMSIGKVADRKEYTGKNRKELIRRKEEHGITLSPKEMALKHSYENK